MLLFGLNIIENLKRPCCVAAVFTTELCLSVRFRAVAHIKLITLLNGDAT